MINLEEIFKEAIEKAFFGNVPETQDANNSTENKPIRHVSQLPNANSPREKASAKFLDNLLKERQKKFFNSSDPINDKYFFITEFYHTFFEPEYGLGNSLEDEIESARTKAITTYAGHDFLTKLNLFLSQSNVEILQKIGEYLGFEKAVSHLLKIEDKKPEAEVELSKLFRNFDLYKQFLLKINDFGLIVDGKWAGKNQDMGALTEVLKVNRWIIDSVADKIFIQALLNYYKLPRSYNSSFRSQGNSRKEALSNYKKIFRR